MSTEVRCATCLRIERWDGDRRDVVQAGGQRRPAVHPTLAAWYALRDGRAEGRRARGSCVCGQPLLDLGRADPAHPPIPWTLALATGPITVDDGQRDPTGALSVAQVTERVTAEHPERGPLRPAQRLFEATLLLSMTAPMLLWAGACLSVILFLLAFTQKPGLNP